MLLDFIEWGAQILFIQKGVYYKIMRLQLYKAEIYIFLIHQGKCLFYKTFKNKLIT